MVALPIEVASLLGFLAEERYNPARAGGKSAQNYPNPSLKIAEEERTRNKEQRKNVRINLQTTPKALLENKERSKEQIQSDKKFTSYGF